MKKTYDNEMVNAWQEYFRTKNPFIGVSGQELEQRAESFINVLQSKEDDPKFTWILSKDQESSIDGNKDVVLTEEDTNEQPSLKFGVPAIPNGNPETADFFVGLINPSVPNSPEQLEVVKNDKQVDNVRPIGKVTTKEKKAEIEAAGKSLLYYLQSSYKYDEIDGTKEFQPGQYDNYLLNQVSLGKPIDRTKTNIYFNPTNIVASEFDRAFHFKPTEQTLDDPFFNFSTFMNSSHLSVTKNNYPELAAAENKEDRDQLRKEKKNEKISEWNENPAYKYNRMYYVSRYFGPMLLPLIKTALHDAGGNSISSIGSLKFSSTAKKHKKGKAPITGKNEVMLVHDELQKHGIDFNNLKICHLELFPYRSRHVPNEDVFKLATAEYSALIIINRIIKYCHESENLDETETAKVQKPVFALRGYYTYWRRAFINALQKARQNESKVIPDELNIKKIEQFIWFFSSDQTSTISKNNLLSWSCWEQEFLPKNSASDSELDVKEIEKSWKDYKKKSTALVHILNNEIKEKDYSFKPGEQAEFAGKFDTLRENSKKKFETSISPIFDNF